MPWSNPTGYGKTDIEIERKMQIYRERSRHRKRDFGNQSETCRALEKERKSRRETDRESDRQRNMHRDRRKCVENF